MQITNRTVYQLAVETTRLLMQNQTKLQQITWTNGESNIDTEYSSLACSTCTEAWSIITQRFPEYDSIGIKCTIPDINIEFFMKAGAADQQIIKKKIELKSSKTSKMPGSTIKKLDINQPLIYCLRPSGAGGHFELKCSQYHHAMGESDFDLFQDRTPRPFINFDKMPAINRPEDDACIDGDAVYEEKSKDDWIEHYADCAVNRLERRCQKSWQDPLVESIGNKLIAKFIASTSVEEFQKMKLAATTLTQFCNPPAGDV